MRAFSIISTTTALFTSHVHGATDRKLEALTEIEPLAAMENFFGTKFERKLKELPTSCELVPEPWNGPIWETYTDSINYKWSADEPSATEKYAMAFDLDANVLKDKVSKKFGINSVDNSSVQCTQSCKDENDVCTFRGATGVCIPRWDSLSSGVALAAILEKEPRCPFTYNYVDFHPYDVKGLISIIYAEAGLPTIVGGRPYLDDAVSFDQNGRPTESSFRDVTPAFHHITVSNILCQLKRSLVIDRYPGRAVWDQALSRFKVDEQKSMTPSEAAQSIFKTDSYPFNDRATQIVQVTSTVSWNSDQFPYELNRPLPQSKNSSASYHYILELNEVGEIIGGEWLGDSIQNHPDYTYIPTGKPFGDLVTNIGFNYANVLKLVNGSSSSCGNDYHPNAN